MTAPRIFEPEYYARMRALEAGSWWNAGMRDVARLLLDQIDLPPSGLMLDVGCGSGQTMMWFAERYRGWRTIGLDVAWEGLAAARRAGTERVFAASALALPLPDRSVDLAVTLDVMQHLPLAGGDATALTELRRVLKPGGHLFVRTNAQAFPRTADDPKYNFHKYDPSEFRAKLESAGFSVMRLSRLNALLGLAEIPRELRARRTQDSEYHGLLADPAAVRSKTASLKRAWLQIEGRFVSAGWRIPFGRTIVALCRAGR
jgi:ubiquinone/menaquinone biosynthesis C-methylase UbiE